MTPATFLRAVALIIGGAVLAVSMVLGLAAFGYLLLVMLQRLRGPRA